jgi:hypothetical protein
VTFLCDQPVAELDDAQDTDAEAAATAKCAHQLACYPYRLDLAQVAALPPSLPPGRRRAGLPVGEREADRTGSSTRPFSLS